MINKRLLVLPLLLFAALFIRSTANAAGASTAPTGITVSPAFQQVSIQATELEYPISFSITNNKAVPINLNLSSADFNTLNESGGLLFVGTIPSDLQKKYGLAKWLSLPDSQITIAPKQTAVINANILNLSTMPAGGHYGALLISDASSSLPKNKVALQPVASSLLFVNKIGGDTHVLGLSNVYINHSIIKLPSEITLRFRNNGNTHLIPRGIITITNSKGKLISKGIINDNSGIILPETYRRYTVPMQKISGTIFPTSYKVRVDFRFDGTDQFRRYQQSIFFVPPALAFAILIIVIAAIYLTYSRMRRPTKTSK